MESRSRERRNLPPMLHPDRISELQSGHGLVNIKALSSEAKPVQDVAVVRACRR